MCKIIILFFLTLFFPLSIFAAERIVNLTIAYKTVYFAGKPKKAIAVNNQIPAPTLHFKEGDHITINVYNCLDKPTSIHWHGVLVPWQMDGVAGVSQKGIPVGSVFHYQFTLKQAGTYWYHAHAGLEEQEGLYGGFIIDPTQPPLYQYTKDYVVVLSDWSNTDAEQILANLKKEGDYYSPRFPLQPSLVKFIHDYRKSCPEERRNLIDDYKMMQQMRMSIYDLSDVAYDAFLLNGHSNCNPWIAPVKVGDIVRLRFIGASGDTIFRVKISETIMQMVHVQGNDVIPYEVEDFTIAPGETYDVLVRIRKKIPYIIYAESRNTLGAAYGALVTSPCQYINFQQIVSFSEPLPVTREMMSNMMMNDMAHGSSMNMKMNASSMSSMSSPMRKSHPTMNVKTSSSHSMSAMKMDHNISMNQSMDMSMPSEPSIIGDAICPPGPMNSMMKMKTSMPMNHAIGQEETGTVGTKYQDLTACVKTNDPSKSVYRVIRMELFGYMDRFIWFINGLPEYKVHPICLESGKRYRIIFTNNSMMHHPMHIHGHWFILRNGHGDHDPLLHTMDVPPGATVTADIDADASGQWFFHCHLLYHMVAGMSRVFQYSSLIEVTRCEAIPQNVVKDTSYLNRPIVRVDETFPIDASLVKHPMSHSAGFWLSTFLDMGADPFHNAERLTYKGLYGSDYNKLELFTNDAEVSKGNVEDADIDIFYWHLISQFWAIKGGANHTYRPANTPYWQPGIGIEGLMPYFIDTNVRGYYHNGSAKLDIELLRDSQITNNFFIRAGIRSIVASKTIPQAAIGSGLNQMRYIIRPYYRLMPGLNIFAEYEHEQDYGVFKSIQNNEGESSVQNTVTFGFSILF